MREARHGPKEQRWLLFWIVIILAASCLPYIVAWQSAPSGYQFAGILANPMDGHSYLAKMRQGWLGDWQFHLTYSPEPHQGAYIFLTYLALGHLARLLGLPLVLIYHAARIICGLALLLALHWFLTHLTHSVTERRLAFLLVSLSAGLGWLGAAFGRLPIDLWVPEGFAFYSMLSNPHFPLAMALMLVLLGRVVWPANGAYRWLLPGMAGLGLSLVLPFALLTTYVSAGVFIGLQILSQYAAYRRPADRRQSLTSSTREIRPHMEAVTSAVIFSLPVLIYDAVVYTTNPALSAWASQNVTPAPALVDLLLGYGLLMPLAIVGVVIVSRQHDRDGLAVSTWGLCTILLVYLPIALQRRLITGLGMPLAMLAALAVVRWLLPALRQRRWIPPLTIFLCAVGNVFLLLVLSMGAQRDANPTAITQSRLFLSADENAGAQWLLHNATHSVVLTDERLGMFLPGMSGVRVVYGHEYETIDAPTKKSDIEAFYSPRTARDQRQRIATRYGVEYVLINTAEQPLNKVILPESWTPVESEGDITLFGVP